MATTFSAAMRAPARELAIRGTLTFPSGAQRALTGQEIVSCSISEGTNDGLLPGKVLSAGCTLELPVAELPKGEELVVSVTPVSSLGTVGRAMSEGICK